MTPSKKKWIWLAVRVAIAVTALAWTLLRVPFASMKAAAQHLSWQAGVFAVVLTFANLWVGAIRWRALLVAFGATELPSVLYLTRVYLVGLFYNTFLPANVGGDVLRAHVTRSAFKEPAGAYVVVAVERVFGLAGLLLLCATVMLVSPIPGVFGVGPLAALAIVGALAVCVAPAFAHRFADKLPPRLAVLVRAIPRVANTGALVTVLLLSVATQVLVAWTGHVLVAALDPSVAFTTSLVLVPLAIVATYFPATVAGMGVREMAFVALFARVHVTAANATAASLSFLAVQLVVALAGGLCHLLWPFPSTESNAPTAPTAPGVESAP